MSYILDALKKSEQQRPPGPVPDLFTVQGPQVQGPRRPVGKIVAGSLLLAALGAGVGAWFSADERDVRVVRPPAAAAPAAEAVPPAAPVTAPAAAPPRPAPSTRSDRGPRAVPEPPVCAPRGPAVLPQTAPPVIPAAAVSAPVLPAQPSPTLPGAPADAVGPADPPRGPAAAPATSAPGTSPAPTTAPPATVPVPPPPSLPVPAASLAPAAPVSGPALEPAAELAPPADGRVLDRAELPQQVQASLPPLRISAHVWSEEPALRLLSVDDRLVHEGAEAAPGVVLREITPAGAVFERAGWRFRVSGGRP